MSTIHFTLPICPKSTQYGNRGFVRNGKLMFFTDKEKRNYQATVSLHAAQYKPSTPLDGPIELHFIFIVPRPKYLEAKKCPDGLIPCAKKPDYDNLAKGTQDALSNAGFWVNDSQIFDARIQKFYAERNGSPRIGVTIKQTTYQEST